MRYRESLSLATLIIHMQLDLSYLLLRSATVKQVLKNQSTNGESLSLYQLRCLNCQFSNASSPDGCFE